MPSHTPSEVRKNRKRKKKKQKMKFGMTPAKAKKILADGSIGGKAITPKQKRLFGLIASGKLPQRLNDVPIESRRKLAA